MAPRWDQARQLKIMDNWTETITLWQPGLKPLDVTRCATIYPTLSNPVVDAGSFPDLVGKIPMSVKSSFVFLNLHQWHASVVWLFLVSCDIPKLDQVSWL